MYGKPDPHDLCLPVYTSGTTGTPKGVIHEYGQLPPEMLSERRPDGSFRENPKSRRGLIVPLNFVASIKFIIHFYYSGGHLYVLDYDTIKNPKKLNAYFLKNRIEGIFMSPSLMRIKKDGCLTRMSPMRTTVTDFTVPAVGKLWELCKNHVKITGKPVLTFILHSATTPLAERTGLKTVRGNLLKKSFVYKWIGLRSPAIG